ncbi:hypothetical protein EJB05_17589, partial [Eragrostis curvula]
MARRSVTVLSSAALLIHLRDKIMTSDAPSSLFCQGMLQDLFARVPISKSRLGPASLNPSLESKEFLPGFYPSSATAPRFRVYDLDMGFGRPVKVDIVSVAKTGAIAVAESRAGDGGMEVGVSLACGWHGQVPEVLC